ncbi:MAG: hypothetical protein ACRDS0_36255 [Pseudonocardiaceae bacterium]
MTSSACARPIVTSAESRKRGSSPVVWRAVSVVVTASKTAAAPPRAVAVTSGR